MFKLISDPDPLSRSKSESHRQNFKLKLQKIPKIIFKIARTVHPTSVWIHHVVFLDSSVKTRTFSQNLGPNPPFLKKFSRNGLKFSEKYFCKYLSGKTQKN